MNGAAGKSIERAPGSWPIGIVMSPLLNLAPCAATGPRVNQHRPIIGLGEKGLQGSVMLSLAPDRLTIEVAAQMDRPAVLRVRRIEVKQPREPVREDLLLLAFYPSGPGNGAVSSSDCFSLGARQHFAPFAPTAALVDIPLFWSESRADSIEGIKVEPARAEGEAVHDRRTYFRRRMLVEIGAAENSRSAAAACRHVELATLYARRLRDSRGPV